MLQNTFIKDKTTVVGIKRIRLVKEKEEHVWQPNQQVPEHIDKTNPHKVHIFEGNTKPTVVIKQKRIGYNSGITSQQNGNRNISIEMQQC